jgi:hypothetical protein
MQEVEQEPIYLPDVENNPHPSRYLNVDKVTSDLPSITEADVKGLRSLGWQDASIYYTVTVYALFNFYNRWITASGVHAVSNEGHRLHGKVPAHKGYDPQLGERYLGSRGGSSE